MELSVKIGWVLIALIHLSPALAAFVPGMIERLYSVPSSGDLGVLLSHRGVLFLAVLVAALFAAVDPGGRKLASIICAISMVGFLILYARAGLPEGALRKIAIA
ncbi:MAG: hypothetical protein AAFX02_11580 [Pseudomonadota bacterium]